MVLIYLGERMSAAVCATPTTTIVYEQGFVNGLGSVQHKYSVKKNLGSPFNRRLEFTVNGLGLHSKPELQTTYRITWPLLTTPEIREEMVDSAVESLYCLLQDKGLFPSDFKFPFPDAEGNLRPLEAMKV